MTNSLLVPFWCVLYDQDQMMMGSQQDINWKKEDEHCSIWVEHSPWIWPIHFQNHHLFWFFLVGDELKCSTRPALRTGSTMHWRGASMVSAKVLSLLTLGQVSKLMTKHG